MLKLNQFLVRNCVRVEKEREKERAVRSCVDYVESLVVSIFFEQEYSKLKKCSRWQRAAADLRLRRKLKFQ